ncbi:SWIB-domain-containing protein [Sodiomyces alkalinus F11]|uniref:SWIB-domain-containing protein n=1 Tax=Sodiomyces alkalinus (strain CBS 110278 / VKM F-3762 / F11) TaxID=1314773 RepID=A0A3N2PRF2_SODAK|nr:SWIB-domain-containing protein [Sodiomyces alkalinus F11]ROT37077.1 SWIB-domain-containing protein [Sodiomyces alkalinus F11]
MSRPLTKDEEVRYTAIIDSILATADLNTVTRKKIRAGLEMALGGKDLSDQKDAIKRLIEERFDRLASGAADEADATAVKAEASATNGHSGDGEGEEEEETKVHAGDEEEEDAEGSSEEADVAASSMPARKKQKRSESEEDADARLAAELQAQENKLARTRMTRGGSVGKKRKAPRKKSGKKARHDDSDGGGGEGSEESAPKRKAGGGFQKPFTLSFPLAQLVGEPQLSRPQVVKKLWEHIKANELQDPSDKRQIRCDEMMHAVFKQSRVDMFQMNKMIGSHLYPVDEEQ